MGLTRLVFVCVLWFSFFFVDYSHGRIPKLDFVPKTQDGTPEPRGRHRLQLLFPLLIRISTRLATLVPTALMGLMGIILFVFFSKKALIVSLIALFLSLSGKYKDQDVIHIHKTHSYADYNDEEEHFYYHRWPMKRKRKWKNWRRDAIPHMPYTTPERSVVPFKPLSNFFKKTEMSINSTAPVLFPLEPEDVIETPFYLYQQA